MFLALSSLLYRASTGRLTAFNCVCIQPILSASGFAYWQPKNEFLRIAGLQKREARRAKGREGGREEGRQREGEQQTPVVLRWLSQGFDLTLCDASLAALSSKIVLRKNNYSYNNSNINYTNSNNNNVINYNNYSNNIYNSLSAKCRAQSFDFRRVQKKRKKKLSICPSAGDCLLPPSLSNTCEHVWSMFVLTNCQLAEVMETQRARGKKRGRPTKPKEGSHFNIIRQQQQHRWAISRRGEGAEEWQGEKERKEEREAERRREKQREGESSRKKDMLGKREREFEWKEVAVLSVGNLERKDSYRSCWDT